MGMDRRIKKKKWPPKKIAAYSAGLLFVLVVVYIFVFQMHGSTLNVKKERITVSTVSSGPFREFIPITGYVEPISTHFLSASEGGRVEEIYVEAGEVVEKGDPILKLGNTNLLLDIMWREAELFQQSNNLRNTRLSFEQYRLQLNRDLASVDNDLVQQKRIFDRYTELIKDNLISNHEFEIAKDQYQYLQKRKELTLETQRHELAFREGQIDALEASLQRMQDNLYIVKEKQENLTVRAPVSGHLTSLDAEIGESKGAGIKFGQIDILDGFRVRAPIDEHYISRVENGRMGEFEFAGGTYGCRVNRVYPEVTDNRFEVDLIFMDDAPEGITRGLTLHIKLELGDLAEALLLPKGGFYNTSGGNWVYMLDEAGEVATKHFIKLGRQNPENYEVLEGLKPGDKVITSSYEGFGNMERLVLKD
jgi:HlyD family secretion protein